LNLKEASQTPYLDSYEGKIAIINFAENEWANATDETASANHMDIIDYSKQIKDTEEKTNFVIDKRTAL